MEVREQKKRARRPQKPRSDSQIVYTQPKPFNRRRFILRIVTVVTAVLAVIFGMSIFFKVETAMHNGTQVGGVFVSGTEKYTPWQIQEASGITEGDHLLTLNKARISGRIQARLPYVDEVRIGIKLPNSVHIEITELAVVYAVADADGAWWLMDSQGRIIEKTTAPGEHTKVVGVTLDGPESGQQAKALEPEQTQETSTEATETMPPQTEYASEKLAVALQILQDLEKNGILGKIASVDVSELLEGELWYTDQYQILLGDTGDRLSYKMEAMAQALAQMGNYQSGTLDVSFTTWPDQVGYTPFE